MKIDNAFNLYIDSNLSSVDILNLIKNEFDGTLKSYWIDLTTIRVEENKNKGANPKKTNKFPDGFLDFKYRFVIESLTENEEEYKKIVIELLNFLWSKKIPTVAACDFEDELPEKGGRSENCPWPGKEN